MTCNSAGVYLESLSFAQREVLRTAQRVGRAVIHRQLMSELGIGPAIALANHHCAVAGAQLRGAMNKHAREIREL